MLSRSHRIRQAKEFDTFFGKKFAQSAGRNLSGANLILKYKLPRQGESRFGFIVANTVDKRAAVRNRLKRRLRALARQALPKLKRPLAAVVVAKPAAKNLSYAELRTEFVYLLGRAGVL